MSRKLLDANTCIRFLNGDPDVRQALQRERASDVFLSSIVKSELWFGAEQSARRLENLERLQRFFAPLTSLPFCDRCAAQAGTARAALTRAGAPIDANDLLIAATALAHDMTLVTHDQAFARVPGLRVEDWQAKITPERGGEGSE